VFKIMNNMYFKQDNITNGIQKYSNIKSHQFHSQLNVYSSIFLAENYGSHCSNIDRSIPVVFVATILTISPISR